MLSFLREVWMIFWIILCIQYMHDPDCLKVWYVMFF